MERVEFKTRLKELREIRGFSQRDLSKNADIGINTINAYENGKTTPQNVAKVKALADALGVPVEALTQLDKPLSEILEKPDKLDDTSFIGGTLNSKDIMVMENIMEKFFKEYVDRMEARYIALEKKYEALEKEVNDKKNE